MASDLAFKALNGFHRTAMRLTGGRLGWKASGMPMVELTTTGRTSGLPRTVILASPVQDGDAYVLVASRGGDDRDPDWFLNLRADPHVRMAVRGTPARPMRARVVPPEEREELWQRVVTDHRHYAGYQRKTSREIPLVVVAPEPDAA